MERLSSSRFKELSRLGQKKHRRETGLFLVEGVRLTEEALVGRHPVVWALFEEGREDRWSYLLETVLATGARIASLEASRLERLGDVATSQGVTLVCQWQPGDISKILTTGRPIVVLDRIGDPANLGSILRSAWAFGIGGGLLLTGTTDPTNPKSLRASMGGALHLPLAEGLSPAEAAERMSLAGYRQIATRPRGGESLEAIGGDPKTAFLIGSEASGLTPDLERTADLVVSIDQEQKTESLNAAVAAGILLHHHRQTTD